MGCSHWQETAAATAHAQVVRDTKVHFVAVTALAWPWVPRLEPKRQRCLSLCESGSQSLTSFFFFFLSHKTNLYLKSSAVIIRGGSSSAHSKALFDINEVISTVTDSKEVEDVQMLPYG